MQAFVLTGYGGPEATALREVPRPRPARGEVLVRVAAAGLNPVDFKTREGKIKVIQRYSLPIIMGNELAGVVEDCGEGVTSFAKGDRVFARMPKAAMGAFCRICGCSRGYACRDAGVAGFRHGRGRSAGGAHRAPGAAR